jgi:hypothetical protein
MTERLLRDASAMQSVFEEGFRAELAFTVDDEIIRGTGAGQCLGPPQLPALVSVAKESGQAADTVVAENIIKMWSRLLPRAKAGAVVHQPGDRAAAPGDADRDRAPRANSSTCRRAGSPGRRSARSTVGRSRSWSSAPRRATSVTSSSRTSRMGYKLVTKDGVQSTSRSTSASPQRAHVPLDSRASAAPEAQERADPVQGRQHALRSRHARRALSGPNSGDLTMSTGLQMQRSHLEVGINAVADAFAALCIPTSCR